MKTLKREEIYANQYRDLDHLHANIEEFIQRYYNQQRLHSARRAPLAVSLVDYSLLAMHKYVKHGEFGDVEPSRAKVSFLVTKRWAVCFQLVLGLIVLALWVGSTLTKRLHNQ